MSSESSEDKLIPCRPNDLGRLPCKALHSIHQICKSLLPCHCHVRTKHPGFCWGKNITLISWLADRCQKWVAIWPPRSALEYPVFLLPSRVLLPTNPMLVFHKHNISVILSLTQNRSSHKLLSHYSLNNHPLKALHDPPSGLAVTVYWICAY